MQPKINKLINYFKKELTIKESLVSGNSNDGTARKWFKNISFKKISTVTNFIILNKFPGPYLCLPRNILDILKFTEILKRTPILPTTWWEKSGCMSYYG